MRSSVILHRSGLMKRATSAFLSAGSMAEVGGVEKQIGHEGGDVVGKVRILPHPDHAPPHHAEVRKVLHDDQGHIIVPVMQPRHQAGGVSLLQFHRIRLDAYPVEAQRPGFSHASHVRESLLDDH